MMLLTVAVRTLIASDSAKEGSLMHSSCVVEHMRSPEDESFGHVLEVVE